MYENALWDSGWVERPTSGPLPGVSVPGMLCSQEVGVLCGP